MTTRELVLVSLTALLVTAICYGSHAPSPAPAEPLRIECAVNESRIYLDQGWRQAHIAMLYTLSAKHDIDLRQGGLLCDVYRGQTRILHDTPAALWHWRDKNKSATPSKMMEA